MPPIWTIQFIAPATCFPGETSISIPTGKTRIDLLSEGDEVLALENGSVIVAKITKIHKNESKTLIVCRTENGAYIKATPSHPFLMTDFSSKELVQCRIGDKLICEEGEQIIYSPIQSLSLEFNEQPVFNITVEPGHTYFANSIAVHNKP